MNRTPTQAFHQGFELAGMDLTIGEATKSVTLTHRSSLAPDAYHLQITADGVQVEAANDAGFQYAGTTCGVWLAQHPTAVPVASIDDAPAFPVRGFMLDISRNKVPTMATLFALVDQLAAWKINHLQLYTEHTFAYAAHREIWENCSPMTAEEIRELDVYCHLRNIELAANQNSFGHLHRWLKHPAYRHLAESPEGYMTPWGEARKGPFSLNPLLPESLSFISGLYEELLPHFSSSLVNVGCDETFDLGQGASKAACEQQGKGRVYLNFLQAIHQIVKERGKTMMYWGDIILHHPELIPELPRDAIALLWGYEADHPFAEQCRQFAQADVTFWVCPGTSTWNSITGRFDNALPNIDIAAREGRQQGAGGFLLTEWGDNGHWQTEPFSRLAIAAGAYAAWFGHAPTAEVLANAFPHGSEIIELGRVYLDAGFPLHNTSPVFPLIRYQHPSSVLDQWSVENLERALEHVNAIADRLNGDAVADEEIALGARMLRHALRRGLWLKHDRPADAQTALAADMSHIRQELSRLWLLRNRPGGLAESLEPLDMRQHEYESGSTRLTP